MHGFTEDMMPKIKRSVDYTFEAYSGVEDREGVEPNERKNGEDKSVMKLQDDNSMEVEDDSKYKL